MNGLKKIRLFASLIALTIMLYGMGFFLYNSIRARSFPLEKELPLGDVQGIIVVENSIYIGLGDFSRIQKYSMNGTFEQAWNTYTYSKDFTFDVSDSGTPKITNTHLDRSSAKKVLNSKLLSLEVKEIMESTIYFQQVLRPHEFYTKDSVRYFIEDGFSKKLYREQNNQSTIIIDQGLITNTQSSPVNSWLTGLAGIVLLITVNIFKLPEIIEQIQKGKTLKQVLKEHFF